MKSNFSFLEQYWPDIAEIGSDAEVYLYSDADACVSKLRQLCECIVSVIFASEKIPIPDETVQSDKIRILERKGLLPKSIGEALSTICSTYSGVVQPSPVTTVKAKALLRTAYALCEWFAAVYGGRRPQMGAYTEPEGCTQNAECPSGPRAQETKTIEPAGASDKAKPADAERQCPESEPVYLDVSVISVVNYALQQNGSPVVQSLTIVNHSDQSLENVDVLITAAPELCRPFSKHIDYVPANSSYEVKGVRLILNGDYLAGLTEKITGVLHLVLAGDALQYFSKDFQITALAFDEWHGYAFYPELITAFVTPNHPEIAKLNGRAAELLGKWTGDPSLDAYQSKDPNRVLAQAAAVYGALQEQNIVYAVAPASFERIGQRVRLCDTVLQQKMGTCLDLSLLYAACLEAIGLHPLLVLKKGHIFGGVWLEDLSFPESVQDDASLLTKRLASGVNEVAVVECTLCTSEKHASFDDARAAAERELYGEDSIEYIVDVNRARLSGITPLPQRIRTENGLCVKREDVAEGSLTGAPKSSCEVIDIGDPAKKAEFSRTVQWERKLLDLSLRNALINLRLSKTMIPILTSSLDELEDTLSDGSDFFILPRPNDWSMPGPDPDFETMHDLGGATEVIKSEFKNRRLRAVYTEAELSRAVKELYRRSKASLEENGANTLYLALGLLRWYETDRSQKARYAPVVLIPIEIIRKSAVQGYVIRLRDDDPQMNITMLEKMKQDFRLIVNGLDPLPQDEHGIDIRKVFTILRKAVMRQPRWDVLESAYLGIFSFSQFVMWNDIRNRYDDLARNKIVRSLMEGKLAWNAEDMKIGAHVPEDRVFLPLPADASQLYAIESACKGESFVLHGPPGTGKSQTITALIANALAQGKTVLFVAEKMAALEVVKKRLVEIGIDPFCLELHSNKSKKKAVLEQLQKATEVTKGATAETFARKAAQIASLRSELDAYVGSLHKRLPCGTTLFELVGEYEKNSAAPDIPLFSDAFIKSVTAVSYEELNSVVLRLIAAAKETGHPANHPLAVVTGTQYSQQLRNVLLPTISAYQSALKTLAAAYGAFVAKLGGSLNSGLDEIEKAAEISKELALWLNLPRAWAMEENYNRMMREINEMAQHFLKMGLLRSQLLQTWNEDFFMQDGGALYAEWNAVSAKWFLAKAIGMNRLAKQVAPSAKTKVPNDQLGRYYSLLAEYQAEKTAADALYAVYGDKLERLDKGSETDWSSVSALTKTAQESAVRLISISGSDRMRMEFAAVKSLSDTIFAMGQAWDSLAAPQNAIYSLLGIADSDAADWIVEQEKQCAAILEHSGDLKEWFTWNGIAAQAKQSGLSPVVEAYLSGIPHDEIYSAYKKAVAKALAIAAIDNDKILSTFSGAVFNEKIAQFRRIDKELTALTQLEIYCRLASKVPDFTKEAAQSSELGLLQRAIRSRGRGISIRKLFEQIPNLLPRLCPCMLMSPISAAQYLEPSRKPFSLVVFDEASQLPTCKAVGALARGEDAVIVGDPLQMPPTSFFAANSVDEDNLDIEDLESILDDCLALNMPQTHLLWHYRSRHESLIAFSNQRFYDNRLYTFPSVNDRESKVRLIHIDGVFGRGGTRQNRAEAEAIIEELKRRCHDKTLCKLSVGIVTFNIWQQNLIDDLLTDACRFDPELEKWAYETEEPLFIKNLENVQGDERDVILFSIGYGPDETGRVSMNFGPLNREGGGRRLNVAISRARCEMIVFSALSADEIDLSRTGSDGVAALKAFLEYAGGHALAQDENTSRRLSQRTAGIAESICAILNERGYETQRSVGHSAYRIDVGVVDPKNPDQYLLGILLDGSSYETAKTTRDREIAQVGVLKKLGWRILRIWTMDWWDNSKKEINRILAELNRIEEMPIGEPESVTAVLSENKYIPTAVVQSRLEFNGGSAADVQVYSPAILPRVSLSPDEFLMLFNTARIQDRIKKVLMREAPISEELLTKRVLKSFGIARAGSRIQAHMNGIYRSLQLRSTLQDERRFFWSPGQDPAQYRMFRTSGEGAAKRDPIDVPVQEAVNALYRALDEQVSLPHDDLIRESAKLMGYTRSGPIVVTLFEAAINYAKRKHAIVKSANGNWVLVTN